MIFSIKKRYKLDTNDIFLLVMAYFWVLLMLFIIKTKLANNPKQSLVRLEVDYLSFRLK